MPPRMGRTAVLAIALAAYPWLGQLDVALDQALGLPLQLERLLLGAFVFSLFALSVHVPLGLAGLMHLGAGALVGTGAYAYALLTVQKLPFGLSFGPAALAAALIAAAVGAVLGLLCARVQGDAVAMVTLAFAEVWRCVALNAEQVTDGARGINPLSGPLWPAAWAHTVGGAARLDFVALYETALFAVGVCAWACVALARRPLGRAWAAARADPLAAEACGMSVRWLRVQAMAVAGAIAGLGGALWAAYLTTTAEPNAYDYNLSVMALSAVVLGGVGSVRGALWGAALVSVFDAALGPIVDGLLRMELATELAEQPWLSFAQWRWLVFGGLLVFAMRRRPHGLQERAA